ncbi:MAG: rhomboid family intramembrane serine protease [Deltaproteobacteria bacterium]|nr:MAG: rhomboid family intramembrane serine protease [Deltaproteobacteria bacterium]
MKHTTGVVVRVTEQRALADEWALVLVAESLSPSVRPGDQGYAVCVPATEAQRAAEALASYERENPLEAAPVGEPVAAGHLETALGVSAALIGFFAVTGARHPAVLWFQRGSADAARILDGELWRTATALTLHADLAHVVANACVGAFFLNAVCRAWGPGLGLALVLLAGIAGNLLNALAYGTAHVSVGASTAVFGAVGVLTGTAVARRRRRGARGRRALLPIAAGLGLLAMLGVSPRVDLWAHLFGFVCGVAPGAGVRLALRRPPPIVVQALLGAGALAAILGSWQLALR